MKFIPGKKYKMKQRGTVAYFIGYSRKGETVFEGETGLLYSRLSDGTSGIDSAYDIFDPDAMNATDKECVKVAQLWEAMGEANVGKQIRTTGSSYFDIPSNLKSISLLKTIRKF